MAGDECNMVHDVNWYGTRYQTTSTKYKKRLDRISEQHGVIVMLCEYIWTYGWCSARYMGKGFTMMTYMKY